MYFDICLATTDSEPKMTLQYPYSTSSTGGNHKPYKIHELCGIINNFVTVQPDYAPRFVKALTHAVELCGGKSSTF